MSLSLPDNFKCMSFNPQNEDECIIICNLLAENYIEDPKNKFRYDYRPSFMYWYLKSFITHNIGILENNELVGFICGRLNNIMLCNSIKKFVEIDFLCIHKRVRNNKLCPILIQQLYKSFRNNNIYADDCIFTSEYKFTNNDKFIKANDITFVKYYTRFLNIKKLIDAEYIITKTDIKIIKNIYSLQNTKTNIKLIKVENINNDIDKCYELYNSYFKKFDLYQVLTKDEFITKFINDNIIIYKLVDINNNILDFISYYTLDVFVLKKNMKINDAYLFYYTNTNNYLKLMVEKLLDILKNNNIDTLIATNIMDTTNVILNELKFVETNDSTNYFLKDTMIKIPNDKLAKLLF